MGIFNIDVNNIYGNRLQYNRGEYLLRLYPQACLQVHVIVNTFVSRVN